MAPADVLALLALLREGATHHDLEQKLGRSRATVTRMLTTMRAGFGCEIEFDRQAGC